MPPSIHLLAIARPSRSLSISMRHCIIATIFPLQSTWFFLCGAKMMNDDRCHLYWRGAEVGALCVSQFPPGPIIIFIIIGSHTNMRRMWNTWIIFIFSIRKVWWKYSMHEWNERLCCFSDVFIFFSHKYNNRRLQELHTSTFNAIETTASACSSVVCVLLMFGIELPTTWLFYSVCNCEHQIHHVCHGNPAIMITWIFWLARTISNKRIIISSMQYCRAGTLSWTLLYTKCNKWCCEFNFNFFFPFWIDRSQWSAKQSDWSTAIKKHAVSDIIAPFPCKFFP